MFIQSIKRLVSEDFSIFHVLVTSFLGGETEFSVDNISVILLKLFAKVDAGDFMVGSILHFKDKVPRIGLSFLLWVGGGSLFFVWVCG